ncbi:hypothetical protein H5P28_11545 [Ruficoccus amylovorans]|uniref:Chromosomal replication initiator DnaA C-terminal domain-containing protein n=1 Tax=Ruficoccus amylovorans TaxID=1804625 RepID=A0A842HI41_9BACT|nr:helix-turn-helix domain-containing protein [Ruficoccus amylovorans]MBC2594891.1 hypothetical protein [Ruficoccus amylovorans]
MRTVLRIVCQMTHTRQRDIYARVRTPDIALARQTAMTLSMKIAKARQLDVARFFRRDPGTVSHAVKVVQNVLDTEPDYADLFAQLETLIRNEIKQPA